MAAVNIDDPDLSEAERDVIISGLMKEEAKVTCNALVKAFQKCAHGRSFSLAWACRKEHHSMKECMEKYYRRADFKLWKEKYLRSVNSIHAKPDDELLNK